jgi:hypothetical protein
LLAHSHGVKVQDYHADNVLFNSQEFLTELASKGQTLDLSGVGAHHQNCVAEQAIRSVVLLARAIMIHASFHWPDQTDFQFWPYALSYAAYVWNYLPNKTSRLSPVEIFSSSSFSTGNVLQRCRVWGCTVYVLDPALQDERKIPKWKPRARRMFLGFSTMHSSTVGLVLNLTTGQIRPQYHLVFDKLLLLFLPEMTFVLVRFLDLRLGMS